MVTAYECDRIIFSLHGLWLNKPSLQSEQQQKIIHWYATKTYAKKSYPQLMDHHNIRVSLFKRLIQLDFFKTIFYSCQKLNLWTSSSTLTIWQYLLTLVHVAGNFRIFAVDSWITWIIRIRFPFKCSNCYSFYNILGSWSTSKGGLELYNFVDVPPNITVM